jgi:hypothetical protein
MAYCTVACTRAVNAAPPEADVLCSVNAKESVPVKPRAGR